MKISDVVSGLPAAWLTPEPDHEALTAREINSGYACDLLSLVIAGVKRDEAWFTILNSVNVVAVAVLADCPLVVLTEGVVMDPEVVARAADKGVWVVSTKLSTYRACVRLNALIEADDKA